MTILLPAIAIAAAVVLLMLGVEPVPTWFYVFAWYPTLFLLDEVAHHLDQHERVLRNPRLAASLFGWSVIIWLVFEAANFRIDNWYYVFLPRLGVERWAGVLLSFATVVPAILFAERALRAAGFGRTWRSRPIALRPADLTGVTLLGAGQLAVTLAWPRLFFPFIWGAAFLLAEPLVYRRRRDLSLFADAERGEWGRILRLMLSGLAIGLIWELYNYWARGKWVYTVPWLEGTKWFEMPPFGFVGFAFFALEAWSMYAALCALGVAIPISGPSTLQRSRIAVAATIAALFTISTMLGMERWTISSVVPSLSDLPAVDSTRTASLSQAGVHTPFDLAATNAVTVQLDGVSSEQADSMITAARLVVLRGIGAVHLHQLRAIGVNNVCRLSGETPHLLWTAIHLNHSGKRPTMAEVRVWVDAARRACPRGQTGT